MCIRLVSSRVHFLLLFFYLGGGISGCATSLTAPIEPDSSLVIGRIVINNKYTGAFYGALPVGTVEQGIEVEVESRDGKHVLKATTGEQGYFLIPNIPPNTYQVRRVTLEGGRSTTGKEKRSQEMQRLPFTPVPGKVGYIGSLAIDISERGFATVREVREEENAKGYLLQRYAASPWRTREFIAVGPKPIPSVQATQEKAPPKVETKPSVLGSTKVEQPEWKVGYEWRYAWKGPKGSGTLTREIVREDTFEGVPSYVMRVAKSEYYMTKKGLGELAGMSGGKLTLKRDSPYQFFSWPLEVGKEWRNSFLGENLQEKTSQTYDLRMKIPRVEEVKVPAGTFEAFKIEIYDSYSGQLTSEYWYSPMAKWFVKFRRYLRDGPREEELMSFKAD